MVVKMFFGAGSIDDVNVLRKAGVKCILISYFYFKKHNDIPFDGDIMIDSGAFSKNAAVELASKFDGLREPVSAEDILGELSKIRL